MNILYVFDLYEQGKGINEIAKILSENEDMDITDAISLIKELIKKEMEG